MNRSFLQWTTAQFKDINGLASKVCWPDYRKLPVYSGGYLKDSKHQRYTSMYFLYKTF